jgi:hypothetical protein
MSSVTSSGWLIIATWRGVDLLGMGAHAMGHEPFGRGRDGVILVGDQVPGGDGLPARDAGWLAEGGQLGLT